MTKPDISVSDFDFLFKCLKTDPLSIIYFQYYNYGFLLSMKKCIFPKVKNHNCLLKNKIYIKGLISKIWTKNQKKNQSRSIHQAPQPKLKKKFINILLSQKFKKYICIVEK